jgi:hypothetical protein
MKFLKWRQNHLILLVLLIGLGLSGCSTQPKMGVGVMDNAWQQYTQGMMLLEDERHDNAMRKFERSLDLVDEFSPALAGKSLVIALRASEQEEGNHRKVDEKMAVELLDKAGSSADSPQERFIHHVSAIRILSTLKSKKWLQMIVYHHNEALDIDDLDKSTLPYYQNRYAADYFMAVAKYRHDFRQAEPLLKKVVGSNDGGKWTKKANKLYEKVHKITRAASYHTLSGVALKVAILDEVSRGDVAALMVSELKLDSLFAGRIRVRSQEKEAEFIPADMLDHPFKDEVATIMKWNVRGLSPIYDSTTRAYLFKPQIIVNRKNLALMLEDVLIQITGQEKIASQSIGQNSPFPDVTSTVGWFNAVMTVTTRGLMKPKLSGEFQPDDPVTGADLLLAIVTLRDVLNVN